MTTPAGATWQKRGVVRWRIRCSGRISLKGADGEEKAEMVIRLIHNERGHGGWGIKMRPAGFFNFGGRPRLGQRFMISIGDGVDFVLVKFVPKSEFVLQAIVDAPQVIRPVFMRDVDGVVVVPDKGEKVYVKRV